ncbi:MAG: hypothetical protein HGA19_22765, partial [Oscillochloris sp.]|nr:hypothetical protein [Oscillochloris sp.]
AQLANSGGLWGTPLIFMVPGGEMLFRLGEGEQAPAQRPARTTRPETRRKPARRTPTSEEEPIFRPISRPQPHSAMPGQAEGSSRPIWLTRRVIVLIVASIILIFMVSRSLRWSDQEVPTPPATATMLIMPTSQGTSPTLFTTPAIVTPVR